MTRRKDTTLRSAVDDMQTLLDEKHSVGDIYQKLLSCFMLLSKADSATIFSYCDHVHQDKFVEVAYLTRNDDKTASQQNDQPQRLAQVTQLLHQHEQSIVAGDTIQSDWPAALYPLYIGNHYFLVPLLEDGECYAVALLDISTPISKDEIGRLTPVIKTTTMIRRCLLGQDLSAKRLAFGINQLPQASNTHDASHLFLEYTFDAVITTNEHCTILSANKKAYSWFVDAEHHELVGRDLFELIQEASSSQLHTKVKSYNELDAIKNRYFSTPLQSVSINGRKLNLEMTFFQYLEGKDKRNVFIFNNNTSLIKAEYDAGIEHRRFRTVADIVPVGILQTNERWECEYVNAAWCDMAGLGRDELEGLSWVNSFIEEESEELISDLSATLKSGNNYSTTCQFKSPFGNNIWVDLNASPLINHEGEVEGFIATAHDVTLRQTNEAKLKQIAQIDPLTKLANRSLLLERLEHLLSNIERSKSMAALLYLDLDGFKHINDSLGHDIGDAVLQHVAKRLQESTRKNDTVARLGGDEFVVLLEDIRDALAAAEVATKVIQHVAEPFKVSNQELFLTTSIGITVTDANNLDAAQLLKQADIALYLAKENGRNNFQYYSAQLENESHQRLRIVNLLHRALEREEFQVHFQPQANVSNNKILGFEALLRWYPNQDESVPTQEFIPLLEETGLIQPVGRWLIHKSIATFSEWVKKNLISNELTLSINLSPRQFRDERLLATIENALAETKLPAKHITFEITETLLLDDTQQYKDIMNKLKNIGVSIALDDFGTGYSSLSHLKNFPIDIIKIDQSFIRDILEDKEDEAIVIAVLAMANTLHKKSVAEGVDSQAKLDYIRNLGCHLYQGFYLAKALPAGKIENFLLNHESSRTFAPHTQHDSTHYKYN